MTQLSPDRWRWQVWDGGKPYPRVRWSYFRLPEVPTQTPLEKKIVAHSGSQDVPRLAYFNPRIEKCLSPVSGTETLRRTN